MRSNHGVALPLLAVLFVVSGCSRGDDPAGAGVSADTAPPRPGIYRGTFPCADCPGIETTLWLRPDGTYFLGQTYLGDAGASGERYHGLGRWTWDAAAAALTLRGSGPERVFDAGPPGTLTLRSLSDLPHRLTREADLAPFTESLLLEGEYRTGDGGPFIRECRTGLVWRVAERGEHRRLRQQYASVPRDSPALASVRGRLVPGDGGTVIVIEELIRLEPAACP
ncbi:MAG: copper resistance protein NlpE N-terminal domain-containing protein [Gammaproteobacteria bacterium]|jgi:hypothetical protein